MKSQVTHTLIIAAMACIMTIMTIRPVAWAQDSTPKPANWNFMNADEQAQWRCRNDPARSTPECKDVPTTLLPKPSSAAAFSAANVRADLERLYPLSKVARFDRTKISEPGGVFIINGDGIRAELSIQSGVSPVRIKNGAAQSDNGAGSLLTSVLSGRKREEPRILPKGERVYITEIGYGNDGAIRFDVMTVSTTPIIDQGRTRQVTYNAALIFEMPRSYAMSSGEIKRLVDQFLVSEQDNQRSQPQRFESSRPQTQPVAATPKPTETKTIELNQTFEQVEAIIGKPDTIAKLGSKTIYSYRTAGLKVTFTDGKVTDVQ